jgi:hypothetical protein
MTETFKEALMLSNKTYFLEAMSKQKAIKKGLKKDLEVYGHKVKVLDNTISSLEAQNKQLQKANAKLILELKESTTESVKAPEPKVAKGAQKKAFPNGRAGTMAFDSNQKGSIIESTPQGPSEGELGTGVERKFSNEGPNKSAKSQGTEPLLKASSSKTN